MKTNETPLPAAISQVNIRFFASDQFATGIKRKQMKRMPKITGNEIAIERTCVIKSGVVRNQPLTTAMTAAAINARFITGLMKLQVRELA